MKINEEEKLHIYKILLKKQHILHIIHRIHIIIIII